jgi:hypothetical protein
MSKNHVNQGNQEVQGLGGIQLSRPVNVPLGQEKESVMEPTVSVHRKGDDLSLVLHGDFNQISSQQLLQALRKLVAMSLKCFATDCPAMFTFRTFGKVDLKKTASA